MPAQHALRIPPPILPAVLSLVWALAGCSGDGASYPSLASRPAERLTDTAQAPAPGSSPADNATAKAPGPPSAELAARLGHLVEQAQSAFGEFNGKRAGVEKQLGAARGATAGSEEWARATQALSGVESARSLTSQPLADLDRIEVDDRVAHPAQTGLDGPRAADAVAIAQARDTVAALVTEEDAILAKLDGRLAR